MYLDYTKLKFDADGNPEVPTLLLQTKAEATIGVLSNVSNIKISVKFSEPSEMTFDIAAYNNGERTPYYDDVVGYKVIRTETYGVYIIMSPEVSGGGMEEIKSVTAYSLEKGLEAKKFFLEEGTYNFWNPASPDGTIISRILEIAPSWSVGYISPTLVGRYRTFDQIDDYLLNFMYNTIPEKFRGVFVFDSYKKTISVYDIDEERPTLPIYLDFDNLVQELEVKELTDELATAVSPYGADELDIRAVNPTGTNWVYDLSHFIAIGDVPADLAKKWEAWQHEFLANQAYYRGLVSLQASATAQLITFRSQLEDLNHELDDLTNQQSVTIQALAEETTDAGKQSQQEKLDEINEQIDAKKEEISAMEADIKETEALLDEENPESYVAQAQAVNAELNLKTYFTAEEYRILQEYFIEQDITEETFVATDINSTISGTSSDLATGTFSVSGSSIAQIDLSEQFDKNIYSIAGGTFALSGENSITGDVIRATLEVKEDSSFVMSVYAGTMKSGDVTAQSGMITVSGKMSGFTSDVASITEDEITTLEGTSLSFTLADAQVFMTTNAGDYQRYSIQMELFDFAVETLSELATPTYDFSLDTANFIFSQDFKPFRDKLELGKGVYLRLHNGEIIKPTLIEFEVDFENREELSLVFSTQFKRNDNVNTLKDMIEQGYSSGRSFDASKYTYSQVASQASAVSEFMNSSINAAVNAVVGASGQTVIINGSGIHIGGNSPYKIRIVDSMIAMSDDDFKTAKVAIGRFASPETGEVWGVNAELIAGKLLIGNSMVLENVSDRGVVQFKVDASGAWLYNSTFVLADDTGGKIILDPKYGVAAGTGNLFTTDGTTVLPSFIDEDGSIIFDDDGMPENSNFFIDQKTGNVYLRGNIYANDGVFNGKVYATDGEFKGTVYANAGEFTGAIHATSGEFSGTIKASTLEGTLKGSASGSGGAIEGVSLNIGNGAFTVDINGNVVIKNGSISWGAVTGTDEIDDRITNAQNTADDAADDVYDLARGNYTRGTFIDGRQISSPTISGGEIHGVDIYGAVYHDAEGSTKLELAQAGQSGYADLKLYGGGSGNTVVFGINDNIGGISLYAYGDKFLSSGDGTTWASGTWIFDNADVSGITAQFG